MNNRTDPFLAIKQSGKPATIVLIAALGLCYVASWATKAPFFAKGLAFIHMPGYALAPWSPLTYPFASQGIGGALIYELLLLWWLYWVGGDTEREIGSAKLIYLFFIATALGAAFVTIAWTLFGREGVLDGSMIPIGAITVAWGTRNPTANVRMYGVIPISGKLIAIIDAALVLFVVGDGFIPAGIFALVPLVLAWAYASNRLPFLPYGKTVGGRRGPSRAAQSKAAKASERRSADYYDDVNKRIKDREERERLRKLFEGSINEDNDK